MTKASTLKKRRKALRKKLREAGYDETYIAAVDAAKKESHDRRLAEQREFWESQSGDKGYKPTHVDSVLTGQGRATGQAAAAIKRGKTLTRHQYDEGERR